MQVNNTIPQLYPAFNRSLLEIESNNNLREKYNYIVDILADLTIHSVVFDGYIFGYPGLATIGGGIGAQQYTAGDYVIIRTITATTSYDGIYKIAFVPNDNAIVLETPFINVVTGGVIEVYRIFRNKLPSNPEGTALFNVNGYATGRVFQDFDLNNNSAFNVPNSFDRFKYLPGEEYYQPFTYQGVQNSGGFAQLQLVSGPVFIGQTLEITADNFLITQYNGIAQVTNIDASNNITLNRAFTGPVISTGVVNTLPKTTIQYPAWGLLSEDKLIFNGALPFPSILDFNSDAYDMSSLIEASFLTTAPPNQLIKLDQRAYTQFYQSTNTTATQWAIDVVDELGVTHQYIVNFNCSPDNILGLAVGTYDLNQIPAGDFETIPPRGLPVIECKDASYCTYLWGENLCNKQGVQSTNFAHPYGMILSPQVWAQQKATNLEVTVLTLEIGGVPQVINPTGNTYNQATVTGQVNEEIYSNEVALQTGLTIVSSDAYGSGLFSGHWLDIDFSTDFEMKVRVRLNTNFYGAGSYVDVLYKWGTTKCATSYKILNGAVLQVAPGGRPKPTKYPTGTIKPYFQNLPGFIGLTSDLTLADALSEKLCFTIDYTPYAYSGARVLFQDRLGSFIGYNFNLKRTRKIETETDGYEKDIYTIDPVDSITRGFETIQNTWAEDWDIRTDYISEADAKYLEECYTSPNIYIEYEGQVLPAVIKPKVQTAQEKQNTGLRQVAITVRVNRTQYSQRN